MLTRRQKAYRAKHPDPPAYIAVGPSSIQSLKTETLAEIFTLCLGGAPKYPHDGQRLFALISVCRRWRNTITTFPSNWSTIQLGTVQKTLVRTLRPWIARCGEQPLAILLYGYPCNFHPLNFIISLIHRWEILHYTFGGRNEWDTMIIFDALPQASSLVHLTLDDMRSYFIPLPLEDWFAYLSMIPFPELRSLRITDCDIMPFLDAPQLRELRVEGTDVEPTTIKCLSILSPELRVISLEYMPSYLPDPEDQPEEVPTVVLPQLRQLTLTPGNIRSYEEWSYLFQTLSTLPGISELKSDFVFMTAAPICIVPMDNVTTLTLVHDCNAAGCFQRFMKDSQLGLLSFPHLKFLDITLSRPRNMCPLSVADLFRSLACSDDGTHGCAHLQNVTMHLQFPPERELMDACVAFSYDRSLAPDGELHGDDSDPIAVCLITVNTPGRDYPNLSWKECNLISSTLECWDDP